MSNFILAGLFTEGTTDVRFLKAVVKNTLDNVAFDCTGDIETELVVVDIEKKNLDFNNQLLKASLKAGELGAVILFVHADSDDVNDLNTFKNKINPALSFIDNQDIQGEFCKDIVAIVPVFMTESWMLADKELLKEEIGVEENDADLGIDKKPEEINDPKKAIEDVIRKSKENLTKRRRSKGLLISDLYQIIGQKIELEKLQELTSYNKFKDSLRDSLRNLNYLHD